MKEVVIVSGKRTAIGDFNGALRNVKAVDLGITAFKGALAEAKLDPAQIEEVITGQVYQAGSKGNPSRQVTLGAGCPVETVAATINQQCPSSMRAVEIISQQILLEKISIGAAIGIESMTNVPYLLLKARGGYRLGSGTLEDGLLYDGLIDAFYNYHAGVTAENLAKQYNITREEQDIFALESHRRATKAIEEGRFKTEIVPVDISTKREQKVFEIDEHPRKDTTLEGLSKLRPAFLKEGTVTAGNASGINDGAVALILMEGEKAKELGLKPLAKIVSTASAAVDPSIMGIGVVPAVRRALDFAKLKQEQIDLWEINEAFAAQVLACNRELKLDLEKVNVNGSGVSLGHPVGMTGARIILTLMHELKKRKLQYGCASLCAGGGPAMAVVIENLT
ncbi:MAG: thiolase family protein [Bacillota bacterium]